MGRLSATNLIINRAADKMHPFGMVHAWVETAPLEYHLRSACTTCMYRRYYAVPKRTGAAAVLLLPCRVAGRTAPPVVLRIALCAPHPPHPLFGLCVFRGGFQCHPMRIIPSPFTLMSLGGCASGRRYRPLFEYL